MQSTAFVALWFGLFTQLVWLLFHSLGAGVWPTSDMYMLVSLAGFGTLAATRSRWRWLSTALRAFLGLTFLLAVADRFGLFGGPGAPGVSWGDWTHFVADTQAVNAFLPADLAPTLAVLATSVELSLGLTLLLGMRRQLAQAGAAVLLLVYALAMTLSLGPLSPFPYSVYVLATGAWALATVDTSLFSFDALLARRHLARRGSLFTDSLRGAP